MSKSRTIAAIVIVSVLGGCEASEEASAPGGREITADCSYFESIHAKFWTGFRSLPDSKTMDLDEVVPRRPGVEENLREQGLLPDPSDYEPQITIYTQRESRQIEGIKFADDSVVRAWPLVSDETLRYLLKKMAEGGTGRDWLRNFTSASSYCGLPDLPKSAE